MSPIVLPFAPYHVCWWVHAWSGCVHALYQARSYRQPSVPISCCTILTKIMSTH